MVINAGEFGKANGSLSIVNLATGREESHTTGFGEFPGAVDVGPEGFVYVALYNKGIVVWNPSLAQFVFGPGNPVVPGGTLPISALKFDYAGRLHTIHPGNCAPGNPGKEYGFSTQLLTPERTITPGICPFSIAFTVVTSTN